MKLNQIKTQAPTLALVTVLFTMIYLNKSILEPSDSREPQTVGKNRAKPSSKDSNKLKKRAQKNTNPNNKKAESSYKNRALRLTTKIEIQKKHENERGFPSDPAIQKAVIENFFKESHLKFNLPMNFAFKKFINEDEVVGMIGKDRFSDNKFGILAKEGSFNFNQAIDYIKAQRDYVEIIGSSQISVSKVKTSRGREGSGISTIQFSQIGQSGDKKIFVALAKREDNKGDYLFILNADQNFLEGDQDFVDNLYDSVQTNK